jgi:hypothetical protein
MRRMFAPSVLHSSSRGPVRARLALLFAGALIACGAFAQTAPQSPDPAPMAAPPSTQPTPAPAAAATQPARTAAPQSKQATKTPPPNPRSKSAGTPTRSLPNRFAGRAGAYYRVVWGIDSLVVKWTESGEVIRFSWRVLDPERAKVLSDKKVEPSLIDPKAGVSLVVPTMEKIGQLRQTQTPEAGRSYWVAFSNKGLFVKRGDRVNVVIGPFRADGLAVD